MVMWFTALQTHVPREALSRVNAYDAMGSLMFGPIGLALAGPLVAAVGLQTGFLIAAAVASRRDPGRRCCPSIGARAQDPQRRRRRPPSDRGSTGRTLEGWQRLHPSASQESSMPIATPEVYAEMLDRAKAGKFAYPAINCTSSQTIVAAHPRLRRGRDRRHRPVLVGRRRVRLGPGREGHGRRRRRARRVRALDRARRTTSTSRCTPTTARRTSCAGYMRAAHRRSRRSASPRACEPLFQSHMWDGSAVPLKENLDIAERAARRVPPGEHHHGDRDRRRRRRGGRRRGHARRQAVLDRRGRARHRRSPRPRRARPLHGRRDLRQRARRLQAGQRRADAVDPQARSRTAVGAKYGKDKPFDLVFHGGSGLAAQRDPRGPRLRRRAR